ncbi:MAG: Gfo/Idh/MocA family oxidoreductase [Pirellulaceae bacterium]|nr:Gfo/Idh/MocA family oxidoreductase [Pirellulaceae bacterium]
MPKPSPSRDSNASPAGHSSCHRCGSDSDCGDAGCDALEGSGSSRRNFIKNGGMILAGSAIVGSNASIARAAHGYGSDLIKVGLIGCGRRGTAAAVQALNTSGPVQLVAMADVFDNNLHTAYRTINGQHSDKVNVKHSRFVGLDGYRGVMQSDADVVILATPPGFRPLQFEAAIAAGKHVFMEKPVATDAPGVRRVLAAGEMATQKGLAVQVGLQRRHERRYQDCIERLKQGAIGDPIFARAYWNGGNVAVRPRRAKQTELEYQLRNWYYFNWLCGDLISEQHIHNLDVINWLLDSHPIEAQGQGGREIRRGVEHGQIFDHHMIEYSYAGGVRMLSQCRQMPGCWNQVGEHIHGTNGSADISAAKIYDRGGKLIWKSDAEDTKGKGWQQEQHDLFAALRRGDKPNETQHAANSTMTAILGRLATYSGKIVRWDDAITSDVQLAAIDSLHTLDCTPPVSPSSDGHYPAPVPGSKTRFV